MKSSTTANIIFYFYSIGVREFDGIKKKEIEKNSREI